MNRKKNYLSIILGGWGTTINILLIIFLVTLKKPLILKTLVFQAFLLGGISGLGYAYIAYRFNKLITRKFIFVVLLNSLLFYTAFHLLLFQVLGERAGVPEFKLFFFLQYSGWKEGSFPEGVILKILEVLQFLLGALFPSLIIKTRNYCHNCHRYMKSTESFYLHSFYSLDAIVRLKESRRAGVINKAIEELEKEYRDVERMMETASLAQIKHTLSGNKVRLADRIAFIKITLILCGECDNFLAHTTLFFLDEELRWKRDEVRLFKKEDSLVDF